MRTTDRKNEKERREIISPIMTRAKLLGLEKKLIQLKNSRPKLADEVSRLAQLGDFSENAEYQMAKGQLRRLNNTILSVEAKINRAVIIKPPNTTSTVQIGHEIKLKTNNKIFCYRILGPLESDPSKGIISNESPIGRAVLGKRVGDEIKIKTPEMEMVYKILQIKS